MSSILIIAGIVVLLVLLVCYAFVAQSIQHKKEQRARLKTALQSRVRTFKHMLEGFPQGFLPNELKLLVQKSLVDIYGQLTELDPSNESWGQDLQILTQEMSQTQRAQPNRSPTEIQNPQIIKETKKCLEELYKFIFQMEENQRLNRPQADGYRAVIRGLVAQLSVDNYLIQARAAQTGLKTRLAIHHYEAALNIMSRENGNGQFTAKIEQIKPLITELTSQAAAEETAAGAPMSSSPQAEEENDEWGSYGDQDDDPWKKKQIYD